MVRYRYYGLDWDITGLQLTPNAPEPGLPTLAIINGGSANWYEFFLDPRNEPGLAQFLAQRLPVMLVTIPGNYTSGGWTNPRSTSVFPDMCSTGSCLLMRQKLATPSSRLRSSQKGCGACWSRRRKVRSSSWVIPPAASCSSS